MKILSIEPHLERATVCVETDSTYQFLTIDRHNKIQCHDSYSKADYKDFDHFVGIMGKFDPHCLFMKEPLILEELTYAALVEKGVSL